MEFRVYNENLIPTGTIHTFLSSVWQEKYCDRGICQLVVQDSKAAAQLLIPGSFIGKPGRKTLWQIKSKEKKDKQIWASGFTTNYTLLDDRIYDGIHQSNLVEEDLRAAVMEKRPAPIVGLGDLRNLDGTVVSEHTYPTLFALSKDLCGSVDYGFRFLHDRKERKLLFDVWQGAQLPNAKFAEKFGNLANLILQQSENGYKNVAYVSGQGEGAERIYITCGETSSEGLSRHELFVDARNIRKTDDQTQEEYEGLLVERGLQKLNETNQKLSVTFDVNPNDFEKQYFLGDRITCLLPEDGLKLFVRVIAFQETIEDNKTTMQITVGTPIIQTIGG